MTIEKKDGFMTLSGTFGVCGVRNNNSRVYETSNYKKMVEEMQERIKADGGIPGELEHPQYMNITLENISHKITDINIDENGVVSGTITLLNTPKGKIAQSIVEGGLPLFISSRAMGNVDPKTGAVTLEKISTYDLVGTPGFSQARLHLNESQMVDFENKMNTEGKAEVGNDIYTQISDSNIFYVTEKEQENKIEENNMEMNEILEKLNNLETKINHLEEENKTLKESLEKTPNFNLEQLAESIQNWCVNEFAPQIQGWITEEFAPEHKEEMVDEAMDAFKTYLLNEAAPKIQTWVVEEFGGEIERWATTEFAQGIQSWIVEEYAPATQEWLTEHYAPKVEEQIANAVSESKKNSLSSIDDTLKLLEGLEVNKPTYKSVKSVNEDAPKFIQEMPESVRPLYESASDEMKESINRRAKIYNFNNEGAIQRFWESIDFNATPQVKSIYEGLDKVVDERERAIRESFRRWRALM
jgi:hypothetical protein